MQLCSSLPHQRQEKGLFHHCTTVYIRDPAAKQTNEQLHYKWYVD